MDRLKTLEETAGFGCKPKATPKDAMEMVAKGLNTMKSQLAITPISVRSLLPILKETEPETYYVTLSTIKSFSTFLLEMHKRFEGAIASLQTSATPSEVTPIESVAGLKDLETDQKEQSPGETSQPT